MVVISLGTNLGNRLNNLKKAVSLMSEHCLYNVKQSIVLETVAIVPEGAPEDWNKPYLNMIVCGDTKLSPQELLRSLKSIERKMGRPEVYEKWSPRIIDLDILFYDDMVVRESNLIIPHPELKNRRFFQHILSLMGIGSYEYDPSLNESFTNTFTLSPQMVGVVNVTRDSFSDGGRFYDIDKAVAQVNHLGNIGASIVEIGVQSTRPGAQLQSPDEEYEKLNRVLEAFGSAVFENQFLSIDVLHASTAIRLLQKYPIYLINSITGDFDDDTLKVIANKQCKYCVVHSLTVPANSIIISDDDPMPCILEWGRGVIDHLLDLGFSSDNIILDPGIGFGKNPYQNIRILQHLGDLRSLNCQIMVGHSRKSFIGSFSMASAAERDVETIAISQAIADKIDFLRVHNVRDHMRAMVAQSMLSRSSYCCQVSVEK